MVVPGITDYKHMSTTGNSKKLKGPSGTLKRLAGNS